MSIQLNKSKTSQLSWLSLDEQENIKAKILSLDRAKRNVELLLKIEAGYRSGLHRHTCETRIFIISGEIYNHCLNQHFREGDYCYQATNDTHDEEFIKESIIYVNYCSENDLFIEFLDSNFNVLNTLNFEHFEDMMASQSTENYPKPPPPGV